LELRVKKIKFYVAERSPPPKGRICKANVLNVERCEEKRTAFHNIISLLPQDRIYYIDECGINSYIYREHAYAKRGVKVTSGISGKKFKRANIVAAKCGDSIVAPMIYDGTTDSTLFEYWFEHCLLKSISPGSYCIMDNAAFHRKSKLHILASRADCAVIFLPPYSPDLNPIESYWAWLKQRLRKTLPSYDGFMDALCGCF